MKWSRPPNERPDPVASEVTAADVTFVRAVVDAVPDHIYVKDDKGRYLLINEAGLHERGVVEQEAIIGKTAYDLVPREVADRMSAEDGAVMESGEPLVNREAINPFVAAEEGTGPRWHITIKTPLRGPDGSVVGIVGVNRDITERKHAEITLREREQTFRAIFEQAAVGISMTALDLGFIRVNDRLCELLGYSREELLAMSLRDVNPPENMEATLEDRQRLVQGEHGNHDLREKELLCKDGRRLWVSLATSLVRDDDGEPKYFVSVVQDISEAKHAAAALRDSEERFRRLAYYDLLTDLPNRALFQDRLRQMLVQAQRNRWTAGVMLLDLDRFKQINDSLGHAAGDLLLAQVSARLTSTLRAGDTVARLGGDEFAIALSRLAAPQDAALVAQKIIASFDEPFPLEGQDIVTGISVGIALYPQDGEDQDTLLKRADAAMYWAKAGHHGYQFHAAALNARAVEVRGSEPELRRALERGEFVLHYQPRLALADGAPVGAEALLRWAHPERGLLAPPAFIELLEESALVPEVGSWVLEEACRQIEHWQGGALSALRVSANLFPRQFIRGDLVSVLNRVLATFRVDPALFELEITETALMADAGATLRILQEVRALGVRCVVDDCGSAYSSLAELARLPLDAVKIDRAVVGALPDDAGAAAVTRAAIALGHSFGLPASAVGVENEAQLAYLAAHGCDYAQGYYFARPMPAAELAEGLGRLAR